MNAHEIELLARRTQTLFDECDLPNGLAYVVLLMLLRDERLHWDDVEATCRCMARPPSESDIAQLPEGLRRSIEADVLASTVVAGAELPIELANRKIASLLARAVRGDQHARDALGELRTSLDVAMKALDRTEDGLEDK